MPKRPTKKWIRSCIRKVEKSGYAEDPGAVCGSVWYHKMSSAAKRKIVRESEK